MAGASSPPPFFVRRSLVLERFLARFYDLLPLEEVKEAVSTVEVQLKP